MATSREIITRMHARGVSYEDIGRLVGRDSSLIGQIARGKKPGTNLTPSLEAVSRVRKPDSYLRRNGPLEPPRRVTRAGTPAQVRRGGDLTKGMTLGKQFHQKLSKAAREDRIVSLTVRAQEIENYHKASTSQYSDEIQGEMEASYAKHGISARTLLDKLDAAGWQEDAQKAFETVLRDNPALESVHGFRGYSLTITDRKGNR
jgi:hypothetical protein